MAPTTPSSSLARYRPVVLGVTAFAACWAAYLGYTVLTKQPEGPPLHRSNAVRRRNHRRENQDAQADNHVQEAENILQSQPESSLQEQPPQQAQPLAEQPPPQPPEGYNIKSLLYYIAEEQANREGYIHRCVTCNSCETKPIRGIRWRCMNCADYDLCSDCEAQGVHDKTHIFYKIKIPAPFLGNPRQAQPVIYPGRPKLCPPSLDKALRRELTEKTKYDPAEIDALYEQFTCLANQRWLGPKNKGIPAAIDRKAFSKAFVPYFSINLPRPNLIYDRTFAFYDTDKNQLIGFEEFVMGLSSLKGMSPDTRLRHVFNGYDMDEDGFVTRKDFLRMFRAYYAIMKEMTRDLVAVQEEDISVSASLDLINSSAPLASRFMEPFGTSLEADGLGKFPDRFGDLIPGESDLPTVAKSSRDRGLEEREQLLADAAHELGWSRPDGITSDGTRHAVNERWRRRGLYTDEEEGFMRPHDYDGESVGDLSDDGVSPEETPEGQPQSGRVSPRSRSSSKVRFQEDPEFEIRSNASTSSRPVGERWGGYEIPEAEKDLGKETMYIVAEQGFNELLDVLFKQREDEEIEMIQTKVERKKWGKEIAAHAEEKRKLEEEKRKLEEEIKKFEEQKQAEKDEKLTQIRSRLEEEADPLMATALATGFLNSEDNRPQPQSSNTDQHENVSATGMTFGTEDPTANGMAAYEDLQRLQRVLRARQEADAAAEQSSTNMANGWITRTDESIIESTESQALESHNEPSPLPSPGPATTQPEAGNHQLSSREEYEQWEAEYRRSLSEINYDEIPELRLPAYLRAEYPAERFSSRDHYCCFCIIVNSSLSLPGYSTTSNDSEVVENLDRLIDMTMPQNRPNSANDEAAAKVLKIFQTVQCMTDDYANMRLKEFIASSRRAAAEAAEYHNGAEVEEDEDSLFIPDAQAESSTSAALSSNVTQRKHKHAIRRKQLNVDPNQPPDTTRLDRLVKLNEVERGFRERHTVRGRLNYTEWEAIMKEKRRELEFVCNWLEVGSF